MEGSPRRRASRKSLVLYLIPILLFLPIGIAWLFTGQPAGSTASLLPEPLFSLKEADYHADPRIHRIPAISLRIIRDLILDEDPYEPDSDGRLATVAAVLQTPIATTTPSGRGAAHISPTAAPSQIAGPPIPETGPSMTAPAGNTAVPTTVSPAQTPTPVFIPASPTATPYRQPSSTSAPTQSAVPFASPTPTSSPTQAIAPTASTSPSLTRMPTLTLTSTPTASQTTTPTQPGSPSTTTTSTATPTSKQTLAPSPTPSATATMTPTAIQTTAPTAEPDPLCVDPLLSAGSLPSGFVADIDPPNGDTEVSLDHTYVTIFFNSPMNTGPGKGWVESDSYHWVVNLENDRAVPILNRVYNPANRSLTLFLDTTHPFWIALWHSGRSYKVVVDGAIQNACSVAQGYSVVTTFQLVGRR